MRPIRLLSAPDAIAIDAEPLGIVDPADWPAAVAQGFELVPAWQARALRGRRRALATLPAFAVAAAVALSLGRGHDPAPVRATPVRAAAPARPALVVQPSPAPATDGSSARR